MSVLTTKNYEKSQRHPFDDRLDEIINSTPKDIEWGEPDENGKRKGSLKMPHFESDDETLAEAADWLNHEAERGEIIGLRKEKTEDGGLRMLLGHPRRNATISVDLDKAGNYKKIKLF